MLQNYRGIEQVLLSDEDGVTFEGNVTGGTRHRGFPVNSDRPNS